ncbi:MAG: hypothetical protein M1834_003700 [Cirrosporium novae-zelandiae]|nr:MAG: hypothetical protein M1834_003700 [Cirrosporium novae-zelandiae]
MSSDPTPLQQLPLANSPSKIPEEPSGSSQASSSTTKSSQGLFQCGDCKRSYTRLDHLARHVRSHTQEKPYSCHICSKSFARPDLVKRHAAGHDSEPGQPKRQRRSYPPGQPGRVTQACKACATAKLKCEEEKPCRRCRQRNISCLPSSGEGRTKNRSGPESNPNMPTISDVQTEDGSMTGSVYPVVQVPTPETSNPETDSLTALSTPSLPADDTVLDFEGNTFHDLLRDVMIPAPLDFGRMPNLQGYHTPLDFGIDNNWNLNEIDFSFLDSVQDPISGYSQRTFNTAPQPESSEEVPKDRNGIALGTEAFRKSSLGRWIPAHQDHGYAEQPNLSLPVSQSDNPEFDRRILGERLASGSRDKILGMVLGSCQPANVPRVLSSFPSAEMLDSLMQRYFDGQSSQIDSWIHSPSFRPGFQRPELLAAIAAAGAIQTPGTTIRKLGFALQEAVRIAMPEIFEADNARTRDLQTLQSYALCLDMGLWSGNRRKMEIAESHAQPVLTMLRRAGCYQRSKYTSIVPQPSDEGDVLHQKWLEWVEIESFKRMVFHMFLHDSQASMSLQVGPLISYAEMNLPLPEVQDLWQAQNAAQWKAVYLSKSTVAGLKLPSLVECIRDISTLSAAQEHLDMQLSSLAILHAFSHLIWEHRQLSSVSRGQPSHWNSLVLNSRHQEILQVLHHFRMEASEWEYGPAPEVALILELLFMHLHMSFDELQLFAGKENREEARGAYFSAKQWIQSHASRQAIWHAGQIVRAAKCFQAHHLRGFYAISLYHAGLALWSYGVVWKAQEMESASKNPTTPNSPSIWLDEAETPELQRFVMLRRGLPRLQRSANPASLDDPVSVMNIVHEILRSNCGDETPPPPLVDSLSQLVRDLGNAAKATSQQ